MARYVIGPDVALRPARDGSVVPAEHRLPAPTLIRANDLVPAVPLDALRWV